MNSIPTSKTIKINCEGAATQPLEALTVLQGNLKKLTKQNLARLKKRIIDSGFCAPFFIWDNDGALMILDGTQRRAALMSLREDGYTVPALPVVYIHAASEQEARTILLSISSQYGEWVESELAEWLAGIDAGIKETLREVDGEIEIVTLSDMDKFKTGLSTKNLEPYKRVHVLLSMSQDTFFEIQDQLSELKSIEGVEYEQSQN